MKTIRTTVVAPPMKAAPHRKDRSIGFILFFGCVTSHRIESAVAFAVCLLVSRFTVYFVRADSLGSVFPDFAHRDLRASARR